MNIHLQYEMNFAMCAALAKYVGQYIHSPNYMLDTKIDGSSAVKVAQWREINAPSTYGGRLGPGTECGQRPSIPQSA